MDEFNPYAPPRAGEPSPLSPRLEPRGFQAYRLVNWLYAGAMLAALLILLRSGTLRAEFHHLLVVAIFLAPVLSFALVLKRCTVQFHRWFWVQGLGSAALLLLCLLDFTEGRGLRGIGVFMTLANALALFAGEHFLELRQAQAEAAQAANAERPA
ncbi:MAG TPA: hypothetical protein VER09_03095 [Pseudomonas sp.]|nr:hypothetical protein [Pseudomonas sp.]